jgi:hypothetical protein
MTGASDVWVTESNTVRQSIASLAEVLVGLALIVGFRGFEGPGLTGSRAGFLLGVLLAVIGAGMLLFGGKQLVTVDPQSRRIILEKVGLFGRSSREVSFDEISRVYVGRLGDSEGGSIRYHVTAELRSGKEVALFLGFFEGSKSESAMDARRERLVGYLSGPSRGPARA